MFLRPEHQRTLLDEARRTIRRVLGGASPVPAATVDPSSPPPDVDPGLLQPAGCFVSLHALHSHRLRGCVGRLDATQPLLEAVRTAAVNVLDDPRFHDDPVSLAELNDLEIEISVLSPLRPVQDPLDFDLMNDGIYLVCGGRTGCFLPQVARETGWPKDRLLARLCTEKLGLPPTAWRLPDARLYVFTTLVIGPEPFGGDF